MIEAFKKNVAVPFPLLFVALAWIFIGFIGIILDSYSYISTNILLLFSSLLTLAFIIQTILAGIHP